MSTSSGETTARGQHSPLAQLAHLFTPEGVHELRVPNAGRLRTISGYYDDPAKLAAAAAETDARERPPGVYFTINPVDDALLARSANKTEAYVKITTSDHDIARRRWLVVDLDPKRPAGIPSTDAEHAAAAELGGVIVEALTARGWPEPIVMDSGNGRYLLYRVDLPNSDQATALVQGALAGLAARFDTDTVHVDQTMYNAARIIRVPGTVNRKGSGTDDRPHRRANLVSAPFQNVIVTLEQLAALAPPKPAASSSAVDKWAASNGFDIEAFIATHLADVTGGPKSKPGGGRVWVIETCPFNPDHGRGEAYLGQMPSGALYAGCHHDSCTWRWAELRAKFAPVETADEQQAGPGAGEGDGRPELRVGSPAVMAEWIRGQLGTGSLSGMFVRDDKIVHTPREGEDGYIPPKGDDDHDGPAQVRTLTPGMIAARIQWTYRCVKLVKNGDAWIKVPAMFPVAPATTAANAADMIPNLRRLRGVTHTPLVRVDGSILTAPGYDPATGLLHLPEPGLVVPAVPDRPARADVERAVRLLDEMTAGFTFVSVHHRANYYGYLLTPLLREITPPPYKMGVVTAPQPGAGKTLLATVVRLIHGGVFRAEMPEDDAELRKQVTAILDQTTGPVIQIDNVTGILRSSVLAGLLTSNRWDDRLLGSTAMVSRDNDRFWMLTGNNVAIGGDLPRRSIETAIDPGVPHPEKRTGFAIADLESWVRDKRGELLWALLTLIRAWVVDGRKLGAEAGSDGYARWVRTVRGILAEAGVEGAFDHDETRRAVGTDDEEWADFLAAIYGVFGDNTWTAKELLGKFATHTYPLGVDQARPLPVDCLPGQLADKVNKAHGNADVISRSLGNWLRNRAGRWAGPHTVRLEGRNDDNKNVWKIEKYGA